MPIFNILASLCSLAGQIDAYLIVSSEHKSLVSDQIIGLVAKKRLFAICQKVKFKPAYLFTEST